MKKFLYAAGAFVLLILAGFFIPLGSYKTTGGCQLDYTPTVRLHLIKGETLKRIRNSSSFPEEGCSINSKYVLYFF